MESHSTWRESGSVDGPACLAVNQSWIADDPCGPLDPPSQEQVQSNADLDIPTQQELLAQFRCDEIATVAVEAFFANLKGVKRPVETGQVLEGLGSMLTEWKALALSESSLVAARGINTLELTQMSAFFPPSSL